MENGNDMKQYDPIFEGEGTLDPSDRATGTFAPGLTYWRLVQIAPGMDRAKLAHPGEFCHTNAEGNFEFRQEMRVIILESRPRNTRFEDKHVACRSYDGIRGPEGQTCRKDCEYFGFRKNDIPTKEKCKGSMILLCLDADETFEESFFVELSAAGITDWREYASWLQDQKHRPVFACTTRITSKTRKQGGGEPYVPVFRPIEALPVDMLDAMRERRAQQSHYLDAPDSTPVATAERPVVHWDGEEAPPPEPEDE